MVGILVGVLAVIVGQVDASANSSIAWKSPDGAVAAVIPGGFRPSPLPPNGQVVGGRWEDERTGCVIAAYQMPLHPDVQNKPINMNELTSGFNDAFVASISGRLVQSSTETINGFPTATMTAESNEAVIVAKQRLVVTSTTIYALGVTGNAKAFEEDARLTQALASLTVQPSATPPPAFGSAGRPAPMTQPAPQQGPSGWNKLSGELGVFGVVLLVICYAVSRQSEQKPRKKKKKTSELQR